MVNGDNGLRHYLFANISLRGISFPCLKLYRVAQKNGYPRILLSITLLNVDGFLKCFHQKTPSYLLSVSQH